MVLFYGPLYLDVLCSNCLPEEYMLLLFREMTPGLVSVFSTLLGSTADTCTASVYEAFWKNFTRRSCGLCRVGFTDCDAPRVIFLLASPSPKCSASWPVWTRSTVTTWCTSSRLQTVEPAQLQSIVGRRHLFRGAEAVSHGPDSSSDHRFSPVAVQGGRRPCLQVVLISLSWRRGLSHGPDCLDHCDSLAAVLSHGDRCSCCAGLQVPGAVVVETVEFSQCRHARWRADMWQIIVVVIS